MANKRLNIRGGINIKATLPSGAGDPVLTRDETTSEVGKIPPVDVSSYISTALNSAQLIVGNASNIAQARTITGDISFSNTGVSSINNGVIFNQHVANAAGILYSKLNLTGGIVNSDVNTTAGIGRTKLASGTAYRVIVNDASGIMSDNSAITPSRVIVSDINGLPTHSTVTSTVLGYLDISSSLTQLLASKLSFSGAISPSEGDIIQYVGGAWVNIGIGSSGTVLTSNGANASWQTGTSNGLPSGGAANQYLRKIDGTNYNATWDTLTVSKITDLTATAANLNILAGTTATAANINFLFGLTSNAQAQLNGKLSNSLAYGAILVGDAGNTAVQLSPGTNGYILKMVGSSPQWQPETPPGNVSGVAPSTDNAIARWNGVSADSIQNSGIIIDDSNNITGIASLSSGQIDILNQAALRLHETGSTNYVGIRASGTMSADYTITLPAAAPASNTYLKYDGANYVWDVAGGGGGAVSSVSGTTDRITVSPTTGATVVDIAATYAGQASITTVGTIASGVWNGTSIDTTYTDAKVASITGTTNRITISGTVTSPVINLSTLYAGQTTITTIGTVTTGTWNAAVIGTTYGGTGLSSIGTANQLIRVNAGGTDLEYFTPTFISGNQNITLSGDVTGSGTTSITTTLATVNSNVGTFGSTTQSGQFTVNGKGLITAASNITITPAASSITGGQALTKTDDTNVTLTLGGTPSTALLQATSLTLGWTGVLSLARGGTGSSSAIWWPLTGTGTLTGDVTMSGAFSVGIGTSPSSKLHVVGLGNTTGELVRFASSTPTTRFSMLDNGQTSWVGSVSGANAIGRSDAITVTATANSQTQTGWDYNFSNVDGSFSPLTRNIAQWRMNGSATPILLIQSNQISTNSISLMALTFAGDMTVRNTSGALYLRGGSGSTTGLKFGTSFSSSTNNNVAFNFTATTHNVVTGPGLTRTFTGVLLDFAVQSSNVNTITFNGWDYNPDLSSLGGSTLTHNILWRSGNMGIRQNTPTAILHLGGGSTGVGTSPLKFTSGTNMTTPEDGAMEYNGSHLYFTIGSTRYQLDQQGGGSVTGSGAANRVAYWSGTSALTSDVGFEYNGSTDTLFSANIEASTAVTGTNAATGGDLNLIGGNASSSGNNTGNVFLGTFSAAGGGTSGSIFLSPASSTITLGTPGSQNGNGTWTINSVSGAVSAVNGQNLLVTSGNAYNTSGNGNGGNITIQSGLRRVAGTGVDGSITFDSRTNATFIGSGLGLHATTSGAGTLTLDRTATVWVFTGTTTTWTLPAVSGNTDIAYFIKNRGSGNITLQRAGSDNIYDTTTQTSITISPGQAHTLINDGTYWLVL